MSTRQKPEFSEVKDLSLKDIKGHVTVTRDRYVHCQTFSHYIVRKVSTSLISH
jgi:hypothetical protein